MNAVISVHPLIVATRALAAAVADGKRRGEDRFSSARALIIDGVRPRTVDEAVSAGAMLLAAWSTQQKGPGSTEWPEKLHRWLDDWENDFRRSDAGDEASGFRRLVALLDRMADASESSAVMQ
jgi:hypothetical protein